MSKSADLLPGTLDLLILKSVSLGKLHAPDDGDVHLGGGVGQFDEVAVLFCGVALGGRRRRPRHGDRHGQRKLEQFHAELRLTVGSMRSVDDLIMPRGAILAHAAS